MTNRKFKKGYQSAFNEGFLAFPPDVLACPSAEGREVIRRQTADWIMEAIEDGGKIQMETLAELLRLLQERTDYDVHIEVGILVNCLLKTVDNEADAQETIRRLRNASSKAKIE